MVLYAALRCRAADTTRIHCKCGRCRGWGSDRRNCGQACNCTMSFGTATSLVTWVPPSDHIGTNSISEELGLNPVASILVRESGSATLISVDSFESQMGFCEIACGEPRGIG